MRYFFGRDLIAFAAPPDLVESFARGWARARGLAPPVADGAALRIETGQPHEVRRYIFSRPPRGIAELAAGIDAPGILLKAAMAAEAMAALLPAHWHVEQTGTTMTANRLPLHDIKLPADLTLHGDWRGLAYHVSITDAEGVQAARGRMTATDDWALHDAIEVAEAHRRRGLGTAVMLALAAEARRQGLTRGLLNATVAGRALYETLGWQARAPWTTAEVRV